MQTLSPSFKKSSPTNLCHFLNRAMSNHSLLSPSLLLALSNQAAYEFQNGNVYVAASLYFQNKSFPNIASYFLKESDEERKHGLQIFTFITDRLEDAVFKSEPFDTNFMGQTPLQVFQAVMDLEINNSKQLDALHQLAKAEKDSATEVFVGEMIKEQTMAIGKLDDLLKQVTAFSAFPGLLYHLDAMIKK